MPFLHISRHHFFRFTAKSNKAATSAVGEELYLRFTSLLLAQRYQARALCFLGFLVRALLAWAHKNEPNLRFCQNISLFTCPPKNSCSRVSPWHFASSTIVPFPYASKRRKRHRDRYFRQQSMSWMHHPSRVKFSIQTECRYPKFKPFWVCQRPFPHSSFAALHRPARAKFRTRWKR